MKKAIMTAVTCIVMLASLVVTALAADTAYYFSEADLTVDVPDEYLVFTIYEDTDEEKLAEFGLTEEYAATILSDMLESGIYLRALSSDSLTEHIVTISPTHNLIKDFDRYTDYDISLLFEEFRNEYTSSGVLYDRYTIYKGLQTKFLAMTFTMETAGTTVYGLQYYTVYDGNAVSFTARSYGSPISENELSAHLKMVDSAYFYSESSGSASVLVSSVWNIVACVFAIVLIAVVISSASKRAGKKKAPQQGAQRSVRNSAPSAYTAVGTRSEVMPAGQVKFDSSRDDDTWNYSPHYRPPMYYCDNCGAKIYEGETKCSICGTKVSRKKKPYDFL